MLCIVVIAVVLMLRGVDLKDILGWSETRLPQNLVGWSKQFVRQAYSNGDASAARVDQRNTYRKNVLSATVTRVPREDTSDDSNTSYQDHQEAGGSAPDGHSGGGGEASSSASAAPRAAAQGLLLEAK